MEATTAKAVPAAPATSRPPEPKGPPRPKATYAYRDIPGWFVRLHQEQWQGKGGSTTQRRGPNQNCGYIELAKYWKVCDASRVQENLDEMKTEAWLIVVFKT